MHREASKQLFGSGKIMTVVSRAKDKSNLFLSSEVLTSLLVLTVARDVESTCKLGSKLYKDQKHELVNLIVNSFINLSKNRSITV